MNAFQIARAEQLLQQFETRQPDSKHAQIAKVHLREMLAYPERYTDVEARDVLGQCEARLIDRRK